MIGSIILTSVTVTLCLVHDMLQGMCACRRRRLFTDRNQTVTNLYRPVMWALSPNRSRSCNCAHLVYCVFCSWCSLSFQLALFLTVTDWRDRQESLLVQTMHWTLCMFRPVRAQDANGFRPRSFFFLYSFFTASTRECLRLLYTHTRYRAVHYCKRGVQLTYLSMT
jgi:hypothetical protein